MSTEALALALNHSRAKGTAKIVLLGIANHDGDGGSWPSVATLARYAGVDARNVQKALARLEALGEVRRRYNAGGTHSTAEHLRPNLYEFLLRCPSTCDGSKNHRDRSALRLPTFDPLAESSPPGGIVTGGVAAASPEPPLNQTTKTESADHSTRAPVEHCPGRSGGRPHDAPHGWCDYCGHEVAA